MVETVLHCGWLALQAVLIVAGLFSTLLGLLTIMHWIKTPKLPADTSNRINNIQAWWLGLTRPEILARSYKNFQNDVADNLDPVEKEKA